MRVLTHFGLRTDDNEEVSGITLTVKDPDASVDATFPYPECADGDDPEGARLVNLLDGVHAAAVVVYADEDAKAWFEGWLLPDAYLLDNRVAPPQPDALPVVEMSGELSDESEATIESVELNSDLSGSDASELTEAGVEKSAANGTTRKRKKRVGKLREGAGCKQPDEVNGWAAGRLLCVTKSHRTSGDKPWGRCEYRVRCNKDGSYTLEYFAGARTDVKQGDTWPTASHMFKALLGLPPETRHHKMTIKRYFNL